MEAEDFNICFSLTPKKMDFVVQSNGFKWTNIKISPIQMDFMIVLKMQTDFKLQLDQSKWSLQQFHHFK
jgi:hypothetical protein